MPANLIHCFTCRALLNPDLEKRTVFAPPAYQPLPEIELAEGTTLLKAQPLGHYVMCPMCRRELRIADKYVGQKVQCKFCKKPFDLSLTDGSVQHLAFYTNCPHCGEEIRAAKKYDGAKVACKHCDGPIQL